MELGWQDQTLSTKSNEMLLQLMSDLGYCKPRCIKADVATAPGDNFLGCVFRVQVSGFRDNILQKDQWIVKTMPENEARREKLSVSRYFQNEVSFYKNVVPRLSSEGHSVLAIPRCFLAFSDGRHDLLVMEDLRLTGFRMADRSQGLDAPHCHLVLRELARFHAQSIAIKLKEPEKFKELKNCVKETFFDVNSRERLISLTSVALKPLENLRNRFVAGSKYLKKLNDLFQEDYLTTVVKLTQDVEEPWGVITHGDCWTNNLLFRYSQSGTPLDVRLLDFQISRYGSPVFDIAYFVCCCTTSATRLTHFSSLLSTYHGTLIQELEVRGASCSSLTRSSLDVEMARRGGRWGLAMALLFLTFMCRDAGNMPSMDEVTQKGVEATFSAENEASRLCQERLVDILQDLVDLEMI